MSTLEQGFVLEGLRVSPRAGEVSGPGGRDKLDPKVMGVFLLMAERAGEVVPREDLLARLWPNAVVTDDALTRCFYELRRQLSHAGGDERYRSMIETLPKRGYRLNAGVRPSAPATAPAIPAAQTAPEPVSLPPRRRRWVVAASAATMIGTAAVVVFGWLPDLGEGGRAASTAHAIAVLPFLDMSAGQDHAYFSDGVTEEILNRLSQADNLRVISRTSSFALRGKNLDVPRIAERLNVNYVLEGSVRRSGDRVRVTAQLIDAATNSHVWSATYDRGIGDIFAVQDEVAGGVTEALEVTVKGRNAQARAPPHLEAYEDFLQGQFFFNRRSTGDIERATRLFQNAVELDPQYARAWAALAGAYSLMIGELHANSNEPLRKLQGEAALKAAELDPNLAVAHARLAQYYYHTQQQEKGDEHMRAAVALNPDDLLVLGFSASEAVWRDDLGEAVRLLRKAVAQDPLSFVTRGNFGFMLLRNGQLEEALAEFRRSLELNPDAGPQLETEIARVLILLGRHDEALAVIARLPSGSWRNFALALLHDVPGQRGNSDAALARLTAASRDVMDRVHLGEAYAFRGRMDNAFDVLLKFHEQLKTDRRRPLRDQWYFQNEIRMAPLLEPLHSDPRWAELATTPG